MILQQLHKSTCSYFVVRNDQLAGYAFVSMLSTGTVPSVLVYAMPISVQQMPCHRNVLSKDPAEYPTLGRPKIEDKIYKRRTIDPIMARSTISMKPSLTGPIGYLL